jgi:hypothetical protein
MPESFREIVEARLAPYKKFDPEGSGYDEATAAQLRKEMPLILSEPSKPPVKTPSYGKSVPQFEVRSDGAFDAWVWHPEENKWAIHGSSRHPRTGLLLKGRKHPTWGKLVEGEEAAGNVIRQGDDGRYYSFPKKTAMAPHPSRAEILTRNKDE